MIFATDDIAPVLERTVQWDSLLASRLVTEASSESHCTVRSRTGAMSSVAKIIVRRGCALRAPPRCVRDARCGDPRDEALQNGF